MWIIVFDVSKLDGSILSCMLICPRGPLIRCWLTYCAGALLEKPGLSTMHHYFYSFPMFTLCPLKYNRSIKVYNFLYLSMLKKESEIEEFHIMFIFRVCFPAFHYVRRKLLPKWKMKESPRFLDVVLFGSNTPHSQLALSGCTSCTQRDKCLWER